MTDAFAPQLAAAIAPLRIKERSEWGDVTQATQRVVEVCARRSAGEVGTDVRAQLGAGYAHHTSCTGGGVHALGTGEHVRVGIDVAHTKVLLRRAMLTSCRAAYGTASKQSSPLTSSMSRPDRMWLSAAGLGPP